MILFCVVPENGKMKYESNNLVAIANHLIMMG